MEMLFFARCSNTTETTGKTIRLSERVDPSLLGGLRLEADGRSLDGTVAGRLQRMRVTLQDLTV